MADDVQPVDPDLQAQFYKDFVRGVAEKLAVMAGTWLVTQNLLPADQLTGAEAAIGGMIVTVVFVGYSWWASKGRLMLMHSLKMEVPAGYVKEEKK